MSLRNVLIVLSCVAGLAACAAAPTQEMADARAELKAAEEAGAKEYAGAPLAAARRGMADAEQQLALGNYSDARDSAALAREDAARAKAVADAIGGARRALERAKAAKVPSAAAEEALKSAQDAARGGDDRRAVAEAARAEQLAVLGKNQAELEEASRLLQSCPAEQRNRHAEMVQKAGEAIADGNGAKALEYAARTCR